MPRAIVIGAGFGGLAVALRLRAAGLQVDVYDNQAAAGGRAGMYHRQGYTFDAGPTVITAPFLFDELFALFGKQRADYVTFQPLMPWYRICFADGRTFDYGGTREQLVDAVRRFAPGDVEGYNRLLDKTAEIYRVGFEELGDQPFHSLSAMMRVLPKMARLRSDRSVYAFVSSYLKDEALRRVFSFQPLLVGGNPFHTTSIYSLIQHLERKDGVHFAMGGTAALVAALVRLAQEQGVQFHFGSRVREILIEDGRATGIALENRQEHAACVVANADAPALYKQLVPQRWRRKWTDRRIEKLKFSMGLFVLYLGVRKTYPGLAHHTILLGDRYKELLEEIFEGDLLSDDVSLYLHAPTRTDPSLAPRGCESLYVLAPVPNLRAGIDWSREAARLEERILDTLEATVCPGLRQALEVRFHVTPEHFRDNLLTHHGTGFSLQPTLFQSAWFRFHNRSEDVEGLYLVGAGTHPGAGLPGVLCSAKVLEHYVPEILHKAQAGQGSRRALPHAAADQQMARAGKTFYRAARLLPAHLRQEVVQLYSFCRRIDDLADEPDIALAERRDALRALASAFEQGSLPELRAHGWPFAVQGILPEAARLLVLAAIGDFDQRQPKTEQDLLAYAFGVAGTVGVMMAQVLKAEPAGLRAAVALGMAMQLSNIARDVAEDLRNGRVYLPLDWAPAGSVALALRTGQPAETRSVVQAVEKTLDLAEVLYAAAYDGIWSLPWRVRWSILAAAMCYREIGIEVGRDVQRSWTRRTVVSGRRKLWLIVHAGLRLLLPRFWRRPSARQSKPGLGTRAQSSLQQLGLAA